MEQIVHGVYLVVLGNAAILLWKGVLKAVRLVSSRCERW